MKTIVLCVTLLPCFVAFTVIDTGKLSRRYQFRTADTIIKAESSLTSADIPTADQKSKVQRFYNNYEWTNAMSGQTYNINYRVEGDSSKPPIILVHGFGANVNHFRYNFPLLVEAGYQVYAVDLLGFGGSDKPKDAEYSIELWVNLLCEFMKDMSTSINSGENDGEKWIVCGNSIGGLCSLGVTSKLKDLVKGCVLFNCAQGMSAIRYEELPWLLKPIVTFVQKVVLAPDGYGGKFFENFKTRENVESILRGQGVYGDTTNVDDELLEILLGPSEDDGAKEVFLKVFGGDAGPTPEEFLKDIEVPILALWGDSDPWVPVDRGTHQGLNFGQYTKGEYILEILEGVGHCPQDEVPSQIHEKMLPWLKSLP